MAAMSDSSPVPMDIDSTVPSSPPPSAPGAFPNGVNGEENTPPRPPPHRSPTNSKPSEPATGDAEACKAAGNKFFKAKQFDKAIAEYTKGSDNFSSAFDYSSLTY